MGHAVLTSHIIKEAQKVAKGVRGIKCLLGSLTLLQKDIRLFYGPLPSRSSAKPLGDCCCCFSIPCTLSSGKGVHLFDQIFCQFFSAFAFNYGIFFGLQPAKNSVLCQ